MNYIDYLDSFSKFKMDGGYRPGLERVQAALNLLGNPEKVVPVIHIAGTNGKGSTSALIGNILKSAGYKVGLYTSPHLQHFRERFRVNGVPISDAELEQFTSQLQPVIEILEKDASLGRPSYFEVITVLAFMYFAAQKLDALILEVGLGGRLDATNVVNPLISVITTIGFDHMEYLGNTLAEIAGEKAGIIKDNVPVVIGVRDAGAINAIAAKAAAKSAPLYQPVDESTWRVHETSLRSQKVDLIVGDQAYPALEIGLLGEHQIRNTIVALQTAELLKEYFPNINEAVIRTGVRTVKWPGRLELAQENPPVLLDGAHNIEGIEALAAFLEQVRASYDHLYLVMSILKDKDIEPMVRRIAPVATGVTFTQNHNLRVSTADDLAHVLAGEQLEIKVIPDFAKAIHEAIANAGPADLVCITGSLYTIAEARDILFPEEQGVL